MKRALSITGVVLLACGMTTSHAAADESIGDNAGWGDAAELDLMALMNLEVVSASNTAEKLSQAPASVLVVTGNEMVERGYSSLIDIFADLPGVDLAITYGDLYYKAYWRGYRKDASPFLFMIDGRIMNHLWFNRTDMLAAVSLSNIERVEVVYGPASAVYGPNAMMGVFHIITKKDYGKDGNDYGASVSFSGGSFLQRASTSFDERRADVSMGYNKDDFSLQISSSMHNLDMDEDSLDEYQFTAPSMANDRSLWGAALDNPNLGGDIKAGTMRSFMLSSSYKNLEVGMSYFDKASGYGTNYAFDKNNPRGWWREPDVDAYAKTTIDLSDTVTSSTMMRFRRSDVTNDNFSNEGYWTAVTDDEGNETGETTREILVAYWQSLNSAWYVQQDFDIVPSDDLVIKTGLNFEDRDIQKAYDLPAGPLTAPEDFSNDAAPASPVGAPHFENRLRWVNMGAYAQVRYDIGGLLDSEEHFVNAGVRYHNNSLYGSSVTLRGGYVGNLGIVNLKVLGGQSFQEPSAKQLFGAWAGSATSSDLAPEKSTTIETVIDWASESVSLTVNPYYVMVTDLITEAGGSPSNVGSRTMMGGDVFMRARTSLGSVGSLRGWVNYGFITASEQECTTVSDDVDNPCTAAQTEAYDVGDIAPMKVNFGVTTVMMDGDFSLNLRGRYVAERKLVSSNPLGTLPAFFTADANILMKNVGTDGVGLSLRVNNILDAAYSHPGIRGANAGNDAAGSAGWSSSMLPQPGRSIMASLHLDI